MIRRYTPGDTEEFFRMLEEEGEDWREYYGNEGKPMYLRALASSVTYLAFEDGVLCGYARCREDDGFGVYVHDLLVKKSCRGRQLGRRLMEEALKDFPGQTVYVMSDVDPYYEKQGYRRAGSIFEVKV